MRNYSRLFILSAALGGCLVLLACLATLGFAGYYVLSQGNPVAVLSQGLPFAGFAPTALNRIVYVGNDANIYVVDPSGAHKTPLTKDGDGGTARGYDYPAWAPDDRHIAFVGVSFASGSATDATLYNVEPTGASLRSLYKSDQFLPFYLYWSPDSRYITFLTSKGPNSLALRVTDSEKENSMEELDSGAPLYFAWSPDSRRMLLHVGGTLQDSSDARLALLPFGSKAAAQSLASSPGAFTAPQWSPDGQRVLFSEVDGNQQAVAIANAQGSNPKTLFDYQGRIAFSWSPTGDRIAYIVTDPTLNLPNFGAVQVVAADGQNARAVSDDHALAFYWSPNSKRLAYLTVALPANGSSRRAVGPALQVNPQIQFQWKVKDFDTDKVTTLATFDPTESFVGTLPFFDQYARSATFWSPDSQQFVYSTADSTGAGSIWVADASGKTPPHQIGDGMIGFWSWK
jgi:Tol biopolymer transport system component